MGHYSRFPVWSCHPRYLCVYHLVLSSWCLSALLNCPLMRRHLTHHTTMLRVNPLVFHIPLELTVVVLLRL